MVTLTMTENDKQIMKRTFAIADDAFAWIKNNRYQWEQVSPTECISRKRPDCKLYIGGDY